MALLHIGPMRTKWDNICRTLLPVPGCLTLKLLNTTLYNTDTSYYLIVTSHSVVTVYLWNASYYGHFCCYCSVAQSCPTLCDPPWTAACQASLSFTISQSLLKLPSIESVMSFNHLVLCRLFLLLPSIFPSIRVFSNKLALCSRWPKYWSFSFSISPSNEYSGLISFRIDWFDLLAVQGTLKSLFQHHSSKASVLRHSAYFMVQLSHPYTTTGKTIALTIQTIFGKVICFNMLPTFIIVFLPRSKCLSVSWLQSPSSAVVLERKKIKSVTLSFVSPVKIGHFIDDKTENQETQGPSSK